MKKWSSLSENAWEIISPIIIPEGFLFLFTIIKNEWETVILGSFKTSIRCSYAYCSMLFLGKRQQGWISSMLIHLYNLPRNWKRG